MTANKQLTFALSINHDEWLRFYAGQASAVRVTADNGQTLQLPANALRPYILHNGVHGRFAIHFDQNNKLVKLAKL